MIGLLQRVSWAKVQIDEHIVAQIDKGVLVLVGMEKSDQHEQVNKLVHRLLNYRIFADNEGKMNLSVMDIQGGVLLVPQFTLAADTNKGMRPSFSSALPPSEAQLLFDYLLRQAQDKYSNVESGYFGADMKVSLLNDGPVTFSLTV